MDAKKVIKELKVEKHGHYLWSMTKKGCRILLQL